MILKLNGNVAIENLGNCPDEIVDRLRFLLAAGAPARPDPKRQNVYDLQDGSRLFFIDVLPERHKVILLASWLDEAQTLTRRSLANVRDHASRCPCSAA